MKRILIAAIWLASSPAIAQDGLPQMLGEAYACSDASLKTLASGTCEPPAVIAAMAAAKCEARWVAIADRATGSAPGKTGRTGRSAAAEQYTKSLEVEYARLAELKVIDIRTDERRCGFD